MQRQMSIEEFRAFERSSLAKRRSENQADEKAAAAARRERYTVATSVLEVRLPLPVTLNAYYKVGMYGRRPGLRKSEKGKAYRALLPAIWESRIGVTFRGRLAMRCTIVFPDNRKRDIDGYMKCFLDALQLAGAYEDDAQIKLLIVEQEAVEAPGWIDVKLGPKPLDVQGTLFETEF